MKREEGINKLVVIIIIIAIIIVGYFLFLKKEMWQGVYYPNGCLTCDKDYIFSPMLESKKECLSWGKNIGLRRNNESDLYECGKNCKWKDGLMICEETVDF